MAKVEFQGPIGYGAIYLGAYPLAASTRLPLLPLKSSADLRREPCYHDFLLYVG